MKNKRNEKLKVKNEKLKTRRYERRIFFTIHFSFLVYLVFPQKGK